MDACYRLGISSCAAECFSRLTGDFDFRVPTVFRFEALPKCIFIRKLGYEIYSSGIYVLSLLSPHLQPRPAGGWLLLIFRFISGFKVAPQGMSSSVCLLPRYHEDFTH